MMAFLTSPYYAVQVFLESGGWVLLVLGLVLFLMWALVVEQVLYQAWFYPKELESATKLWMGRSERHSWTAEQIRARLVSELTMKLRRSLPLVKTLVAVCPLVGLLGTVTGMVAVFDVMAMMGTGNPRAMASGVSRATIPAMAGMVAALSGLFATMWLERRIAQRHVELEDKLETDF